MPIDAQIPARAPVRETHGDRTHRAILEACVDLSTAEGLEGVSIGRLAREVGMSKSGVASHFPSKQALQLATVEHAARGYQDRVLDPRHGVDPGIGRLRAMMDAWLLYIDEIGYRGGCFFAAAANEFGGRSGPVRDLVAHYTARLIDALEREAHTALRLGELRSGVDPARLAFTLHACVQEANLRRRLLDERDAFEHARAAVADVFRQVVAPEPEGVPT
jgi:AcrR family transcriptional regulator